MAHHAQLEFIRVIRNQFPDQFHDTSVVEFGSQNINGSIRQFFTDCLYIGVDAQAGPDVDVVSPAHLFHWANPLKQGWDVVCSCEMLEHDPHWKESIQTMVELVAPGGLFFGTCAGPNRPEHGTPRTSKPGATFYGPDPEYYRNISPDDLRDAIAAVEPDWGAWSSILIRTARGGADLQWCLQKKV